MIPTFRPSVGERELEAVRRVFESRWLGRGKETARFEARLREYLGVREVVAVNRGTAALHVALEALDLEPGAEVIVPSLTFVACVQAVLAAGGTPVFCEVAPETLCVDPRDLFARVTERTRAIMPVDYGGLACDLGAILPEARARGLRVVEDAAHAFGSSSGGRRIGSLSDVTCFSFDAIKNITCGEGGAVTTDDEELAARVRTRHNLGFETDSWSRQRASESWRCDVVGRGLRYHMSDLNAAIGLVQLERMEEFRARKTGIVRRYDEAFSDLDWLVLPRRSLEETFPWSYVVRVRDGRRDALAGHLRERGVATLVHFVPNHLQPAFVRPGVRLPVTERLFQEVLTLPLHCELGDGDVDTVIAGVRSFFSGRWASGS